MLIRGFQEASAWLTEVLVLRIRTGQDASAQVTEGLTLTECKFLPKAMLRFYIIQFIECGPSGQLCAIRVVLGSWPGSSFFSPAKCVTLLE